MGINFGYIQLGLNMEKYLDISGMVPSVNFTELFRDLDAVACPPTPTLY